MDWSMDRSFQQLIKLSVLMQRDTEKHNYKIEEDKDASRTIHLQTILSLGGLKHFYKPPGAWRWVFLSSKEALKQLPLCL